MRRGDFTIGIGVVVTITLATLGAVSGWISSVQKKAEGAVTSVQEARQDMAVMKKDIEATRKGIDVLLELQSRQSTDASKKVLEYRVRYPFGSSTEPLSIK